MPESEDRGIIVIRGVAANDNGGAEERIDSAVLTLARPIAREELGQARRRQRLRAGGGCRRVIGDRKP